MRQAAADGSSGTDSFMSDQGQGAGEQRNGLGECVGSLGCLLPDHGAHVDGAVDEFQRRQVPQAIEIDHHRGPGQAEGHERHQALTTGQRPGLVAVFGQDGQGLVHGLRNSILEGRRFQDQQRSNAPGRRGLAQHRVRCGQVGRLQERGPGRTRYGEGPWEAVRAWLPDTVTKDCGNEGLRERRTAGGRTKA